MSLTIRERCGKVALLSEEERGGNDTVNSFGNFPYLFEWVVDDLGDLPLPRKSSKSHSS